MDVYSSSVSWVVYFLALVVGVVFIGFAIEEVARLFRKKEHKRLQKQAWDRYENWAHPPEQGAAHQVHHAHK
jgi:hypothetical protein